MYHDSKTPGMRTEYPMAFVLNMLELINEKLAANATSLMKRVCKLLMKNKSWLDKIALISYHVVNK